MRTKMYKLGIMYCEKSLWVILIVLQIANIGATCNITATLDNIDKRARNYKVDESVETLINDFYLTEGWFSVGDYLMPDNTMIPRHDTCGSFDVIYNQGVNPDITTLTTTPTNITACLSDGFNECKQTFNIKMRKCGDDLQYYLISAGYKAAYCFDPPELQSETGIPRAPRSVNFGHIVVKPQLEFSELTNAVGTVQYTPHLLFECSFNSEDEFYYDVYWFINGTEVAMYGQVKNVQMSDAVLHEKTLIENQIRMGFTINCGVRARNNNTGMATTITTATEIFAGIKIMQNPLAMDKNSFATVRLQLTVPLGCQYHYPNDPCLTGLRMFDPIHDTCMINSNAIYLSESYRCGLELKGLKKGEVWDPSKVYEFNVTTTDMTHSDYRHFKLLWKIDDDADHEIWQRYQPDDVTIQLYEATPNRNKICYSHVPSHIRSADGRYFDNQNPGTYVLYRNINYPLEVQEKLALCNRYLTWCTCAVAIRAGEDLFMINRCSSSNQFAEFRSCEDGGILRVVEETNQFKVYTPTETIFQVTLHGGTYSSFMNIDITMSPTDFNSTEGLCGNCDGISTNDLMNRPLGHEIFPLNWRIDTSESTQRKCRKLSNKKRDIHLKDRREIERLIRSSQKTTNDELSGIDKFSSVNMTEEEARNICDDAIKGSLAVREFSNHTAGEDPAAVVDQCIFDVMTSGEASLAEAHVESINEIVKLMFEKDIAYVKNNPVSVQYFKKKTCPNNCSDVGTCADEGTCLCNEHYHGADCSIDDRDPVEILDLEGGGTCNITDGDGCTCFYFRTLDLLPNFFCHVSGERIYTTNATKVIPTSVDYGEQEDMFTGICCVPDTFRFKRSADRENVFTTRYDISVSNDGVHSGASMSMTVFDSTCQELRHDASDVIVELKVH